jgi:predicted SprT family Zn-dependent metalloprotease
MPRTVTVPHDTPRARPLRELTIDLERAVLRELSTEYRSINQSAFRGELAVPSIQLVSSGSRLGCWTRDTRTLELSRDLVTQHSWGVVVEVLKHEMAHQYVHEVMGHTRETPHGPAFRDLCRRMGIDGSAAGLPRARESGEERVVERVARLLALAESANVHEAEAAASAAQRLMLKYNIDMRAEAGAKGYAFAHVGRATGRVSESERILAMVLGKHFFVEVIWVPVYRPLEGKRGSVLELCGTPENLAMAEYVHAYLTETAEQLWSEHRQSTELGSNRDRRIYLAGVMTGFAEKLSRQATTHREQGLVWVADADLKDYFRRRHPHVRHVRYTGHRKNDAYARGRDAGRRIVLRKGITSSPAASKGLLLPPAKG